MWILIAVVSLVPMLMLASVEFGLPLPSAIAQRAETLHVQFAALESTPVVIAVIVSAILFPVSIAVAFAPILANADAIGDLENAHRALKAVE